MKTKLFLFIALVAMSLTSCTENYSNGERIGMVTKFSRSGLIFKSWEGHINVTQTGMNTSGVPFDFSIDRDNEDPTIIATLDSAAQFGWKVKTIYHQTWGWNWFNNRGETNYFVSKCEVLDKNPMSVFNSGSGNSGKTNNGGKTDTIYVVVVDKSRLK